MSRPQTDLKTAHLAQAEAPRAKPLGRILIDRKAADPAGVLTALAESQRTRAPLPHVFVAEAIASTEDVLTAQSLHWGAMRLNRADAPPDPRLQGLLPPAFCLEHAILPWLRIGDTLVIATARPEQFDALRSLLPNSLGAVLMAVALEADIHAEIAARHGAALSREAETWVRADESCRDINCLTPVGLAIGASLAGLCLAALAFQPLVFFAAVMMLAVVTLILAQALKIAAFAAGLLRQRKPSDPPPALQTPLVSVLVPLFREERIASALVNRLEKLRYPKSRLDVVLILEAQDTQTRHALDAADLPPWMRVIEVPDGPITTKPRALNYALRFCRGEIVGIYDAEDAPAPDQIDEVVAAFARAPPEVACLQGILDFYNPRANWLSRCFAIEYATWFRILLPGVARLGFAIPLGGTTVFFRRNALEEVRGWDAHNVTEDADLGIRLARYGYRTELLPSVTREEANNRAWPWVKQRSRWLKGYMLTYLVHMRAPTRLLRSLGLWKFLGFQVFFLTTILQFTLAPALWSFWLIPFGLPHPLSAMLSPMAAQALFASFLMAEAVSVVIGLAAVARTPHRGLFPWVPTMMLYFPLGVLAAYKGLIEVVSKPFYWEKTAHGHSHPDT